MSKTAEINNVQTFKEITKKMAETYANKNEDYGDSFTETAKEFGSVAFVIRLSDKLSRVKQLIANDRKVDDEKIEDTLLDLANYAVMAMVFLENDKPQ